MPPHGTRQDGVLAAELSCLREAAVGLHEHQPHAPQFIGDLLDVAAQYGRQIGVDDGGVTARDELHQRAHLAGERDLGEAGPRGEFADRPLVRGIQMAVQADDGHGADPVVVRLLEGSREGVQVGRAEHVAVCGDALVDLDDALVQCGGQDDLAREDVRAVLVRDAQGVAEPAGDDQGGGFALALQEGVGGDGGPHADGLHRRAGGVGEELADPRDGRVGIPRGVVRQELVGEQCGRRTPRDDVGEGAAPVDPELPASHVSLPASALFRAPGGR